MAKFVTKMALAAFRNFPDIWKTDIDGLFGICDQYGAPLSLPEENTAEDRRKAQDYIRELNAFFKELSGKDEADPEWFFDSFVSIASALEKDPADPSYETWLSLSEGIQEAEWLLYVFECVYTNQGAIIESEKGEETFPKLLLISADKFRKEFLDTRRDMDLTYLYRSFGNGLRYEIFLHEGLDQSEWGFSVMREPFLNPDETFSFRLNLINYTGHMIATYYVRGNSDRLFVYTEQECIVNGDYCPNLDRENGNCCQAEYLECPKRSMETVLTILSSLSQYVLVKDSLTRQLVKREAAKGGTDPAPAYEFDGITVYDYTAEYIPDYHGGKYTGTGMRGTEKRPHIRKATIRYNPRTGQRDIIVSSCVIHRDRFKGFEIADRIN